MCGVTGVWDPSTPISELEARVRRANDTLSHRGPDGEGVFSESTAGVVLAHRRLSIVDLSPAGAQPMTSASGRYVISFNGEVYNHVALRKQLIERRIVDAPFRGHSDTETMLGWIDADGVREAIDRFVGMFAFALWDRRDRTLALVRDRLGIKPMYFGRVGARGIAFGSELSAVLAHPGITRTLDPDAVQEYLRRGCVPAPRSIVAGVHKLEPGTMATFVAPDAEPRIDRYWSLSDVARAGLANPFVGTIDEAADELERTLGEAVALRMEADVPVGAFLSGGIDSSTVVALMQKQSTRRVRTFSIGNEGADYDEGSAAEAVARVLGTDHTALQIRSEEAAKLVPQVVARLDEPFADSSIVPTFLVSELARKHVTVSLSGDGGDELFAGYNRHLWIARIERMMRIAPRRAVSLLARGVLRVPEAHAERLLQPLARVVRRPGAQSHKLARALSGSSGALYESFASVFADPPVPSREARSWDAPSLGDPTLDAMLRDGIGYLPDDILTKVDRASMAVSLEARVPIIDHRVVELAWRIPLAAKLHRGRGKEVLRRVLYRHVPQALVDRPKTGFSVPVGAWMRGPLRDWVVDALGARRLREIDGLDEETISDLLRTHLSGQADESGRLFAVAVLCDWAARR
jgi:asparagine synthase (glutamine-hydrolysing)